MGETQFALPDVGEGVAEGELVAWLVEEGERVEEDQPVAEVETDKAIVEIPAAYDGVVTQLHAEAGEIVPVGDVIVTFDVDEEGSTTESDTGSATADGDRGGNDGDAAGDETDAAVTEGTGTADTPTDRVFAPPSVRRAAREADVDLATVPGSGPGGRITGDDLRAAITGRSPPGGQDDLTASESGSMATPGGSMASGGTPTGADDGPTAGEDDRPRSDPAVGGTDGVGARNADRDRTLAMPATRELAREEDIDIDAVPASERRDGEAYVTPEDVHAYVTGETGVGAGASGSGVDDGTTGSGPAAAGGASSGTGSEAGTGADTEGTQPGDRIPYRGVRRTIGERMATAKYTAPHVSHHDEVDVSDLVETRERLTASTTEDAPRLTYLPFVIKAVVAGLRAQPILNAELDEAAEEIIVHDSYDIGIAVATDAGLMVPVVEDADEKGLLELAAEVRDLAARARNRTISPEELQGSTFTITNLGAIGGEHASPIINYPEVGILALGEIKRKPAVHEGEVVPRDLLTVSMSVDHRVVDGADAARFTNEVTRYLNNPDLLLLE
ncbi:dihydrolipoamide acetyltransferase family protein [Halopenitus sp. POP-27]|uniref:dihydrolipoamide acetyltransferase family protein n=1 Tax=Halopenitus sp. POP-27 TaxID=2994425 RepID=UPI00246842F0|nr:dihydrolipoamide acetyltransferase family protein [Halopenitus sp. POP-27]